VNVKKGLIVALPLVVVAAQALPSAQTAVPQEDRRHTVRMMEAVLSQAVRSGAEHLAEQLGSGSPNVSFFTGQARARGFVLDGYGVFFHVEIPEMQQSVVWSVTTLDRDVALARALDAFNDALQSVPDGAPKLQAQQALRGLQAQVGPLPPLAPPTGAPQRGSVMAANETVTSERDISPVPQLILKDPNGAYRQAIKDALIEAMLEHSRGLNLKADEWLSVAAQRSDSPLAPNEIVTSSTLILRIKGSDLALYDTDRTRKDDIRKKVEVQEF
jgi:hypothetical protein